MADPAPRRRLPTWVPFAGAAIGVALIATRIATLPSGEFGSFLVGLVVAIAVTVAIFAGIALSRRRRMRAAVAEFPHSLVVPIVAGLDTAAATRWLADHIGDADLRLRAEQAAVVVVDASGLRVVGDGGASAPIPAGRLMTLPLTTARVGARRVDALVVGVSVGDVVAPLPLIPVRSGALAWGTLTDAELLDVSGRIREALAGGVITPDWQY